MSIWPTCSGSSARRPSPWMRTSVGRYRTADAHEFQRVARVARIRFDDCADAQVVTVDLEPAVIDAGFGKRHGESSLCQTVYAEHGPALQTGMAQCIHEFVAEFYRNRLCAVVDGADARQVGILEFAIAQHFQEMSVAEIRRTGDGHALLGPRAASRAAVAARTDRWASS